MRRVIEVKFKKPTKEDVEEVKDYIRENKKTYIAVGVAAVVVAGFTYLVMRKNQQSFCGRVYDQGRGADVYTTKPQTNVGSNFISNSVINGDVNAHVGKKRLSYIVALDGSDRVWTSQADSARELGVSEVNISKHINHGKPLPDGVSLTRLGVAT